MLRAPLQAIHNLAEQLETLGTLIIFSSRIPRPVDSKSSLPCGKEPDREEHILPQSDLDETYDAEVVLSERF